MTLVLLVGVLIFNFTKIVLSVNCVNLTALKISLGFGHFRSWVQTMYSLYVYIETSVNLTPPNISLGFGHLWSWVQTMFPSYVYTFVGGGRWFTLCTIFIKIKIFLSLSLHDKDLNPCQSHYTKNIIWVWTY